MIYNSKMKTKQTIRKRGTFRSIFIAVVVVGAAIIVVISTIVSAVVGITVFIVEQVRNLAASLAIAIFGKSRS